MAVYTDVAFEDLERLLGDYDIGEPKSFKGIAEGVENSNFLLQTTTGDFILTLYEKRVSADDLPFFLGFSIIWPRAASPARCRSQRNPARAGRAQRPAGRAADLSRRAFAAPSRAGHCAAVGAALAELHEAGRDFPLSVPTRCRSPAGIRWRRPRAPKPTACKRVSAN